MQQHCKLVSALACNKSLKALPICFYKDGVTKSFKRHGLFLFANPNQIAMRSLGDLPQGTTDKALSASLSLVLVEGILAS